MNAEKSGAVDQAISDITGKSAKVIQIIGQNLMMKQVAKAAQKTVEIANTSLCKEVSSVSNELNTTANLDNISFKKGIDKVDDSIKGLIEDPTSNIRRSCIMRRTKELTETEKKLPQQAEEAMKKLTDTVKKAKEVTKTLDIDASIDILTDLHLKLDIPLPQPPYGLSSLDASTEVKIAAKQVKICVNQVLDEARKGNCDAVNSETIPVAESLQAFSIAITNAAATFEFEKDQINLVQSTNEVYRQSKCLFLSAHEFVVNQESSGIIQAESLWKALNSLIRSLPGNNDLDLIKTVEEEDWVLPGAESSFKIDELKTGPRRMAIFNELKHAKLDLTRIVSSLEAASSNSDVKETKTLSITLVDSLESYKNAIQQVILISNKSRSGTLLKLGKEVVKNVVKISNEAHIVMENAEDEEMLHRLSQTSSLFLKAVNHMENAIHEDLDEAIEAHRLHKAMQTQRMLSNLSIMMKGMDQTPKRKSRFPDLISTLEEFVKPAEKSIQLARELAKTTDNMNRKEELLKEADEMEYLVCGLSREAKTCDIVTACGMVVTLWDDIAEARSGVKEGEENTSLDVVDNFEVDFLSVYTKLHSEVDRMRTLLKEEKCDKISKEICSLTDKLRFLVETSKKSPTGEQILQNTRTMLEKSEKFLHELYKAVLDPNSESKEMLAASQSLSKSLNCLLFSLPWSNEKTVYKHIECLEQELTVFQSSMNSFGGGVMKCKEAIYVQNPCFEKQTKNTLMKVQNVLVTRLPFGDKARAREASVNFLDSLELYKDAAKEAALGIPDRNDQNSVISLIQTVLQISKKILATEDKDDLQNEHELKVTMDTILEKTSCGTTGYAMAAKFVQSFIKDNEKAIETGIPRKLTLQLQSARDCEKVAQKRLLKASAAMSSITNRTVTFTREGDTRDIQNELSQLIEGVWNYETATKELARTLRLDSEQNTLLKSSNKVLKIIEEALNDIDQKGRAGKHSCLAEALNTSLLSIPGLEFDTAKDILKNLEGEMRSTPVNRLEPTNDSNKTFKDAVLDVKRSMSMLVKEASKGGKGGNQGSTLGMITAMTNFKSATQQFIAEQDDPKEQDAIRGRAVSIILQSRQTITQSLKVMECEGKAVYAKNLQKTEEQINSDLETLCEPVNKAEARFKHLTLKNINYLRMEANAMDKEKAREKENYVKTNVENELEIKPHVSNYKCQPKETHMTDEPYQSNSKGTELMESSECIKAEMSENKRTDDMTMQKDTEKNKDKNTANSKGNDITDSRPEIKQQSINPTTKNLAGKITTKGTVTENINCTISPVEKDQAQENKNNDNLEQSMHSKAQKISRNLEKDKNIKVS